MSQLIFHSSRLKRSCWIIYESELTLILWHKCCTTFSKRAEPLHYSIIYSLTCNIHYHKHGYGWYRYRYLYIQNLWAFQMIILQASVNLRKQRGKCGSKGRVYKMLPGSLCQATSYAKLFLCPKSGPLQSKSLFSTMLNLISQMKWNKWNELLPAALPLNFIRPTPLPNCFPNPQLFHWVVFEKQTAPTC